MKRPRDFRAEPDCSLFFQGGEDGTQLFPLNVSRCSGNDVSGDASQNVGLVRRKFRRQIRDEIARDAAKVFPL